MPDPIDVTRTASPAQQNAEATNDRYETAGATPPPGSSTAPAYGPPAAPGDAKIISTERAELR